MTNRMQTLSYAVLLLTVAVIAGTGAAPAYAAWEPTKPVEFVVPTEGAITWLDVLSLAKDAPNKAGALAFIDFMINPDFYVQWDTQAGAAVSA